MQKTIDFIISEEHDHIRVDKIVALVNVEGEDKYTNVLIDGHKEVISFKGSTQETFKKMESVHRNMGRYQIKGFSEFNFNNDIKFKLDNAGELTWENYINRNAKRDGTEMKKRIPDCDEDGFYTLRMCNFITIFGGHIKEGFPNMSPFKLDVMVQIHG